VTRRAQTVVGLATVSLIVLVAGALWTIAGRQASTGGRASYVVGTASRPLLPPFLMFRTLAPARAHGRVAMSSPSRSDRRYVTPLQCGRVHFAGGQGVCLHEVADGTTVTYLADLFDRTLRRTQRLQLAGVPTRVRVSPDGRLAAVTTYAEEESPAGERLAIESVLIDLGDGRVVADLREFAIDAALAAAITGPIDFASVSFDKDGDRIFATLTTPLERYVVVGSLRERRLRALTANLATEALSPDGTRLVVKQRVGERGFWQLLVLDLATLTTRPLDQNGRTVDDQVEWLDDGQVIYHDATDQGTGIWVLAADGQSKPRLLLPDAFSPVVVR
jgi:hypothetical protein